MRNIRLTLAYDGTHYVGWQVQPNGTSVQEVVEKAIGKLTGEEPNLLAAGRTDSGVHALAQVANFMTDCTIPVEKLRPGLQTFLPDDVVVTDVAEVDPAFHATYSAKGKRYRYVILNRRVRDPFVRNYAWMVPHQLDQSAMHEAGQVLLGTHDFRCFESQFPNKATSVRTVAEVSVSRHAVWPVWWQSQLLLENPVADEPFLWIDVVADGFLYNMVRAIVGTLVKVGQHRWTAADVRSIVESRDRSQAGETVPPNGLYLVNVDYDGTGA
jgi:tRNA pseudouridine38-40 synthase